uniref:Uncharacterized protein n=1 Tax=Knipowitschia caucasica TaxID=637954 RepID=A0AAV2LI39_KNICA
MDTDPNGRRYFLDRLPNRLFARPSLKALLGVHSGIGAAWCSFSVAALRTHQVSAARPKGEPPSSQDQLLETAAPATNHTTFCARRDAKGSTACDTQSKGPLGSQRHCGGHN